MNEGHPTTLRDLLLQAQDSENPNFEYSQRVLQEARNNNPIEFAAQLINEIRDPGAPYSVVFLALVLISHCFSMSVIPISKEHRQLESRFPPEMIAQLIGITFSLFLNQTDAVRNTATHLFSLIAMTQIQNITTLGIDRRLVSMLTEARCVEAVLSATECIWNLMLHHAFQPDDERAIIAALFRILSFGEDEPNMNKSNNNNNNQNNIQNNQGKKMSNNEFGNSYNENQANTNTNNDGDMALIDRCIRLLGSFAYLIPRLFGGDAQFVAFISRVMGFVACPQLKEAVYMFLDSALLYTPALLGPLFDPLLESSVADLSRAASLNATTAHNNAIIANERNVVIKIIVLWESVVTREILPPSDPRFVEVLVPHLLPPLLGVMQRVNTERVLDYTEWEPYTAAYSCIQDIAMAQPSAVLPLLSEYAACARSSESPFDREGAIKSFRITLQVANEEDLRGMIFSVLDILLQHIGDPSPRVRAAVVDCLIVAIARMQEMKPSSGFSSSSSDSFPISSSIEFGAPTNQPNSQIPTDQMQNGQIREFTTWAVFNPFVRPLFALGRDDVEPTAKQAFEAIRLIARYRDFDQYASLFHAIVSIINDLPIGVVPRAIDCLSISHRSHSHKNQVNGQNGMGYSNPDEPETNSVEKETVFECFQFLYGIFTRVLSETRNYAVLDMICKVLASVLVNLDERVAPFAEALCSLMCQCFRDLSLSNALTVVASLCVPVPQFIQARVLEFVPLVMEAQRRYNDPGVLIPSIRLVPLLVNRLDLGLLFDELMDNMFVSLKMGETAPAKAEILNVFCVLVAKKTDMFRPFITKLYCAMLYLVTYLENVYRIYLECTSQLVSNICRLCVVLFQAVSREDQKHLFNLSIQLINTVAKMPKLLSQINEELVDVILCLLHNFRDETKQQIQQIPSITDILRSGLKLVQRSDAEIEQLMSALMNSVSNTVQNT